MAKTTAYQYCVPEYCEDSRYDFTTEWDIDGHTDCIAEDAATNYHYKHDGVEADWPLVFRLFDMTGATIGDYEVYREVSPVFVATPI